MFDFRRGWLLQLTVLLALALMASGCPDDIGDDDDASADDDDSAEACEVVMELDCDTNYADSNATDGGDAQDLWDAYSCNPFGYTGSENVYEFTPDTTDNYTFVLSNLTADIDILVLSDCDPTS